MSEPPAPAAPTAPALQVVIDAGHAREEDVTRHWGHLVWHDAEVERVVGLGARRLHDGRRGPQEWVTLADPEGNELCVS